MLQDFDHIACLKLYFLWISQEVRNNVSSGYTPSSKLTAKMGGWDTKKNLWIRFSWQSEHIADEWEIRLSKVSCRLHPCLISGIQHEDECNSCSSTWYLFGQKCNDTIILSDETSREFSRESMLVYSPKIKACELGRDAIYHLRSSLICSNMAFLLDIKVDKLLHLTKAFNHSSSILECNCHQHASTIIGSSHHIL